MGRPARRRPLEHEIADPLGTGPGRVLITGAGGQLGAALRRGLSRGGRAHRADFDVTRRPARLRADLVLHAAAWTDVDGAEADPQGAAARERRRDAERRRARRAARLLLDRLRLRRAQGRAVRRVGRAERRSPCTAARSSTASARCARAGSSARSWLFGWTGHNFVRTMLAARRRAGRGRVVDDQRGSPTYVGHLAERRRRCSSFRTATYHVAADGECTWAEFAEAIFEEAGLDCRVRRITTAELGRAGAAPGLLGPAQRARAPSCPWREGLACLPSGRAGSAAGQLPSSRTL